MWHILCCLPILVGIARAVHFTFTHYFLPDEMVYTSSIYYWFQEGSFQLFQARKMFQLFLLGIAVLFRLDTPDVFIPFFSIFLSLFSSLSMFFGVKISRMYGLEEKWLVPLLFLISPIFMALSGLILTENLTIFLLIFTCYIYLKYVENKEVSYLVVSGVVCGLGCRFKEPSIIFFGFILASLLYRKEKLK